MLKRLFICRHGKNCPIYGIPHKDLKDFTTTEKDFKKGITRRPLEDMLINEDLMTTPGGSSIELSKQASTSGQ